MCFSKTNKFEQTFNLLGCPLWRCSSPECWQSCNVQSLSSADELDTVNRDQPSSEIGLNSNLNKISSTLITKKCLYLIRSGFYYSTKEVRTYTARKMLVKLTTDLYEFPFPNTLCTDPLGIYGPPVRNLWCDIAFPWIIIDIFATNYQGVKCRGRSWIEVDFFWSLFHVSLGEDVAEVDPPRARRFVFN